MMQVIVTTAQRAANVVCEDGVIQQRLDGGEMLLGVVDTNNPELLDLLLSRLPEFINEERCGGRGIQHSLVDGLLKLDTFLLQYRTDTGSAPGRDGRAAVALVLTGHEGTAAAAVGNVQARLVLEDSTVVGGSLIRACPVKPHEASQPDEQVRLARDFMLPEGCKLVVEEEDATFFRSSVLTRYLGGWNEKLKCCALSEDIRVGLCDQAVRDPGDCYCSQHHGQLAARPPYLQVESFLCPQGEHLRQCVLGSDGFWEHSTPKLVISPPARRLHASDLLRQATDSMIQRQSGLIRKLVKSRRNDGRQLKVHDCFLHMTPAELRQVHDDMTIVVAHFGVPLKSQQGRASPGKSCLRPTFENGEEPVQRSAKRSICFRDESHTWKYPRNEAVDLMNRLGTPETVETKVTSEHKLHE